METDTSTTDDQGTDSGGRIDRRRFIELSGAGAAVSALAGCLPSPEDGESGTSTPTGTSTAMQTPDGPPDGNPKIGLMAPLSGSAQFVGTGAARSARIARDDINENGGIMDRDVELVEADTAASPSTAQGEVERLVNEEEVDMIIGTYVSEVTQSILDYTAEFGVPFVVAGSQAPSTVTDFIGQDYERYKNFFRVGPINSNFAAEAVAAYGNQQAQAYGWDTFAFVADRAAWTTPYNDILPSALKEMGYNVDYSERISIETENFSPILNDVNDSGAQAMFRFFAHINAVPMMAEWHERELPFMVEGVHVTSMLPEYPQLSQGASLYELTSQSAGGGTAAITDRTMPFVETYRERFADQGPPSSHPMYMGFSVYDGMLFWAQAINSAGTWDYENFLDNIVDAMLSQEMAGTAGNISLFGADAEYPHDAKPERNASGVIQNYPMTQWQEEGTLETVWPQAYKTADKLLPPWMQ